MKEGWSRAFKDPDIELRIEFVDTTASNQTDNAEIWQKRLEELARRAKVFCLNAAPRSHYDLYVSVPRRDYRRTSTPLMCPSVGWNVWSCRTVARK